MPEKPILSIDIVSDVDCPWCAIGYRQLEIAVGQLSDRAKAATFKQVLDKEAARAA